MHKVRLRYGHSPQCSNIVVAVSCTDSVTKRSRSDICNFHCGEVLLPMENPQLPSLSPLPIHFSSHSSDTDHQERKKDIKGGNLHSDKCSRCTKSLSLPVPTLSKQWRHLFETFSHTHTHIHARTHAHTHTHTHTHTHRHTRAHTHTHIHTPQPQRRNLI